MSESSSVKLDPHKAAEEARARNLNAPVAVFGRLATLSDAQGNRYGSMTTKKIDEVFDEFIEIASRPEAKVLEIGGAFGSYYLMKVFEQDSPADYTVVDIIPDQLKILARRIEEMYPSKLSRLTLVGGPFPRKEVIDELVESGYDAIFAINVFHFLTEEEFVEAFHQVHRLLKPGGKLFVKVVTPYINLMDPEFREKLSNEIKNYVDGTNHKKRPYPGFVPSMTARRNKSLDDKIYEAIGASQTQHMFFWDKEIAQIILESEGLNIEMCEYSPNSIYPFHLNGRENVTAVAQRKI